MRDVRALARIAALAAALAGGCGDFRSPADLRFPQILAVRIEPPQLRPEKRARVDVLVTGFAGVPFETPPTDVAFAPDPAGNPLPLPPEAQSFIGRSGDEFFAVAPDAATLDALAALLGLAPDAAVRIPLRVSAAPDGEARRADKLCTILRSAEVAAVGNPMPPAILIDDQPADPRTPLPLALGTHQLSAATLESDGPLAHAWYANAGKLTHYRSPQATIALDAAGPGVILLVVRNEKGGVAWRSVEIAASAD